MSRFNFSMSATITKDGQPFVTQGTTTWHGIDDAALAKMMSVSDALLAHAKAAADKGGGLKLEMTRGVVPVDAPAAGVPGNGTVTFAGLTRKSLSQYQRELHKAGETLLKMGEENAEKKEGKGKK